MVSYEKTHPETFELVEGWLDAIARRKRRQEIFTREELKLMAQQLYFAIKH